MVGLPQSADFGCIFPWACPLLENAHAAAAVSVLLNPTVRANHAKCRTATESITVYGNS